MTDTSGFSPLVPGFEFMQSLVKSASAALPGIGQWVAPTIDPEELAKRIEELRTVQFWLEQNARMIGATIQAMEVQRMTLSTLKTMNVQMEDLRDSMKIKMPDMPVRKPAAAEAAAAASPSAQSGTASPSGKGADVPPGVVDPLQWWSALTRQFTELATTAMKDNGSAAAALRQPLDGSATTPAAPAEATSKAAPKARSTVSAAGKKGAAER